MRIGFPISLRLLLLGSLVIALTASVAPSPASGAAATHPVIWGDVSCDDRVNVQDVSDLMRRSSGIEMSTSCPGDQAAGESTETGSAALTLRLDPVNSSAHPTDTISVSIFADVNTPDFGLGFAMFNVVFDPKVLTPVSCTSDLAGCNSVYAPNAVKFALAVVREAGLTGTIKLGSVEFSVRGSAGQSTLLSIQAINAGDQLGNPMNSSSTGAAISIITLGSTPTPVPTTPSVAYWYYADVNCDGSITVMDALSVLEYFAVGHSSLAPSDACPDIGT